MSDQPTGNSNNNNNRPPGNNPNNNRRHNNQRRRPPGPNNNPNANREAAAPQGPGGPRPQRPNTNAGGPQGAQPQREGGGGNNQRRRPNRNHNRPKNPNAQNQNAQGGNPQASGSQGLNIERIYEKYLNLLDQHLIARRKYHDLFYRADPAQKNKLERNFYNTVNDLREFENRLAPEARELFEKRNNGLRPDNIYTSNHELPLVGENPPPAAEWADPHFLQSQQAVSFAGDKEESVGSAEDYLKYKNLI